MANPTLPRLIELADRCAHLCAALRHILVADTGEEAAEVAAKDRALFWLASLGDELSKSGRRPSGALAGAYADAVRLARRRDDWVLLSAEGWCVDLGESLRREVEEVGDHG